MKLLITGAWHATPEQLDEIRLQGHEVIWLQQENAKLPCSYSEVEGCVCNGLFLHHPIEKFTSLRFIQLTSAGYDRMPMEYVKAHGISIYNARGVYSIPMAEHVVACVLAIYRKLFQFKASQNNCKWEKLRDLEELYGKRVLILGCGSVGTECARRFQAFGCNVTGLDLCPNRLLPEFDGVCHIKTLNEWLPQAEILIITLPLTPQTHHLLTGERLALLRNGSLVCNIARGGIIENSAVERELVSGRLSACLDVLEQEPLTADSPIWNLSNVIITPHNSFVGSGNGTRLFLLINENLQSFIKKQGLL